MIIPSIQIARDLGFGFPTEDFHAWMRRAGFTEKTHCSPLPGYYASEVQTALSSVPLYAPGRWRA